MDPDAAELIIYGAAELGQFVRADVGRIGIELAHDAADCSFDQFPPIDLLDVVLIDLVDRIQEQLVQLVIVILGWGRLLRAPSSLGWGSLLAFSAPATGPSVANGRSSAKTKSRNNLWNFMEVVLQAMY